MPEAHGSEPPLFEPLVVHRSTLRTWLISLAAIPAVVVGADILWRQRIVGWVTDQVFESDPQTLDARDEIWAWALVIVGGAIVVWGLKELFLPAPILHTDDEGVHVRMRGPFRGATTLPWFSLHDLDAGTLEDDEEDVEVLIVEVKDTDLLPDNPWGGRRFDDRTVALFTTEWDTRADQVAVTLADQAVTVARHSDADRR
ncbi:MAG: hypothetical protein ACLFWM_13315 [Actinomycetota bacterium]